MIAISHIQKIYNKGKKNALRALDDVSLTLPASGLVMLLGASGSGKTTLLNVMGGMDSFDKGSLNVSGTNISKYRSSVLDSLRAEHVGMVFQNYYLLPKETVQENIALTLRMIGIHDEAFIEKRIKMLLSAVNMANFERRKANQLSGGQQQRVAIARALAKDPKIILADEPTGNLDAKNTLEVMRLLKRISKNKLVVVVTHERRLAKHFADHVVEIEDGKIVATSENETEKTIDLTGETDIFLDDFSKQTVLEDENDQVKLYSDQRNVPLKARFIIKNKTLYLDIEEGGIDKVVRLDEHAEMTLHEGKRSDARQSAVEAVDAFEDEGLPSNLERTKRKSINYLAVIKTTFNRLLEATRGQKMLFIGFALGAMLIAYAFSSVFNILSIDDADFVEWPQATIEVQFDDDYEAFKALQEHESINSLGITTIHHQARLDMPTLFVGGYMDSPTASLRLAPVSLLTSRDIIMGRAPESAFEVVVDREWAQERILRNRTFVARGVDTLEALMKETFIVEQGELLVSFDIVGISNTGAPVVYSTEAAKMFLQSTILPLGKYEDRIEILRGRMIESATEILLPESLVNPAMDIENGHTMIYNGVERTVVGVYAIEDNGEFIDPNSPIMMLDDIAEIVFVRTMSGYTVRHVYADDVDAARAHLTSLGIDYAYLYETEREIYRNEVLRDAMPSLIFSFFAIGATALSVYFIIRASMLSRIYEIGVFRSLGVKKGDIMKRFALEAIIMTTVSSLIGFIAMTYIIASTNRALGEFVSVGHVSVFSVAAGIVFIYTINVISGVFPVFMLVRKTPAQINTRYDI